MVSRKCINILNKLSTLWSLTMHCNWMISMYVLSPLIYIRNINFAAHFCLSIELKKNGVCVVTTLFILVVVVNLFFSFFNLKHLSYHIQPHLCYLRITSIFYVNLLGFIAIFSRVTFNIIWQWPSFLIFIRINK